ncbi:MAG: hypothetical protein AB1505_32950 [Candidatus Latescibacterota bacterium]
MADDTAVLQLFRMLPMVQALHDEAFTLAAQGEGGAVGYMVERLNRYGRIAADIDQTPLLEGLTIAPQEGDSREETLQQVVVASSELAAYLRQRIGMGGGSVRERGNDVHEYTFYRGPHYDYSAAQIDGVVPMPVASPAPGSDPQRAQAQASD